MVEHDILINDLHEDLKTLSTPQRLAKARSRRTDQIRRWVEIDAAENEKDEKRKRKQKIKFSDNVVLLEAAARNDIEEVRRLLKENVDPNQGDEDGLTALHQSCIDDFEDLVKVLIEYGADVNARDTENWTPLHAAATCGHTNICRILLENGANILAVNADQSISFDICEERSECLFFLQNEMRRAGITQQDIDNARKSQEINIINDCKALRESNEELDRIDMEGATILHFAAAHGYLELTRYLLSQGVHVNVQDKDGWTPLHAATCWMQPEIIKLLSKVPDVNPFVKTKLEERPSDLAEFTECRLLLEKLEAEKEGRLTRDKNGKKPVCRQSFRASIRRTKIREQGEEAKKTDMASEKMISDNAFKDSNEISNSNSKSKKDPKGCCSIS